MYNSNDRDNVFKVHTRIRVVEFSSHESGLQYLNLNKQEGRDFEGIIHANLITNCPVTPDDTSHVYELIGNDLAGL